MVKSSCPKIISRIFGGLGNQLFCYASARRLALVNNAELVIDDVSGFKRDYTYQRDYQLDKFSIPCRKATTTERLEPFSLVRRYLKRRINQRLPFEQRRYIQQKGVDFDPRLLRVKPEGTLYLEGYWQSEDYFKDVESTIRQDLRIKPPNDNINLAMADHIRKHTSVAVHFRFFDDPNADAINNAQIDYYNRAIAEIDKLIPDAHYYLFSDRPESAFDLIPLPDDRVTTVSHNQGESQAYADLWLMSLCKHFIIANSTFSWWGAWLSTSFNKKIIAPSFALNHSQRITSWGFAGLVPKDWMQI